jgi:hypothetical protein
MLKFTAQNAIGNRMENRIGDAVVVRYGIHFLREPVVQVVGRFGDIPSAFLWQKEVAAPEALIWTGTMV